MNQIVDLWTALSLQRRVILLIATVALFFSILAMSRLVASPTMALLYSGLEGSAAGEVVQALEQRNVAFKIRGGSILVDATQRDQLRMTLASEGLPANGNRGYELLDDLSGFGTTSQMFDAAYWRAKEGELAKTIVASPNIKIARVHIANNGSNPFQRNVTPTASVSITSSNGSVGVGQAKALRYLVSSAVAGLTPDNVAVIDGNGGLIGEAEEPGSIDRAESKVQIIRNRVLRLLEARVGVGNVVVEVSVDTVTESESVRERRFDPESRVAISQDTRESSTSSSDNGSGAVTVASNLPDGDAGATENSSSQKSETREQINYEVSETEREIVRLPGAIKRMTVAVLINGISTLDATGAAIDAPRPDAELAALRELVSASVGFDESRGDVITIKSMTLQGAVPEGTVATSAWTDRIGFEVMPVIQMSTLALVTLLLGLFVVRPVLTRPVIAAAAGPSTISAIAPPAAFDAESDPVLAVTGEIAADSVANSDRPAHLTAPLQPGLPGPPADAGNFPSQTNPVDRLREMIGERQEETVEILRGWLEDREENA